MVNLATLPKRLIVTGPPGAGKTSFCQRVIAAARTADWDIAGLLSLPRILDEQKTGIFIMNVRTGAQRLLASCLPGEIDGTLFGKWTFDASVLTWGNTIFEQASACDLFVVDEIGPLEFDCQYGWTACFPLFTRSLEGKMIVTVRPLYQEWLLQIWQDSVSIQVGT